MSEKPIIFYNSKKISNLTELRKILYEFLY